MPRDRWYNPFCFIEILGPKVKSSWAIRPQRKRIGIPSHFGGVTVSFRSAYFGDNLGVGAARGSIHFSLYRPHRLRRIDFVLSDSHRCLNRQRRVLYVFLVGESSIIPGRVTGAGQVATAIANPVLEIVALAVLVDVQVTELVRFCCLPSLLPPVALYCWVEPLGRDHWLASPIGRQ